MIKEIRLNCGANIVIKEIRNITKAINSDNSLWLPYADIIFETECIGLKQHGDVEDEIELDKVNIPIQLRSIDGLIEVLKELKQELEK